MAAEMSECIAIGIDLGTTFSCVAVIENGRAVAIPNDQGNRITPSIVGFYDDEPVIGEGALYQATVFPDKTVCDAKRMLGKSYDDPLIQSSRPHWNFQVVNEKGKPNILINNSGQLMLIPPEHVSALVLRKMKDMAEMYLQCPVYDAVITVPAYFRDAQRQATKDAAAIAGLNVLQTINEPTAAAIAHAKEKPYHKAEKVLVFDFGGGTLDVSILLAEPNMKFTVLSTHGHPHLGGEIDNILLSFMIREYEQQHMVSLRDDLVAIQLLREECSKAKMVLSFSKSTNLIIPNFTEGQRYRRTLTRDEFETICENIWEDMIFPVEGALEGADLNANDIDSVVLVGGSSRIPKVKEVIGQYFPGKPILQSAHPDESIACGAAIVANNIMELRYGKKPLLSLIDVTPFSLGIKTHGGGMGVFFPKNTQIPAQHYRFCTTVTDYQTSLKVQIFEGESTQATDNRLLGEVELTGIDPAPRGTPRVIITFSIDFSGILNVSAEDENSGKQVQAQIDNGQYNLSQAEIQRIADGIFVGSPDEQIQRERAILLKRLAEYVATVASAVELNKDNLTSKETNEIGKNVDAARKWIKSNQEAKKTAIIMKQQEVHRLFQKVMARLVVLR
ncbi:LOW QUALITY PROTEIN: heat shock 70 kDa protein-like [Paramacrobiotus metropolitanus]|uniref:LOW QUALITY PROTEIN: heat shock 70 kDa protein-like n=1 Tax=Paramacrobiotus metropolitanus TaxID=2943436 RepID=UPI0024461D73|nr:LOW QUALITY PROTEIN: heat shock 70 kDa protein-like [Paramacrobiotus metropolitanus]